MTLFHPEALHIERDEAARDRDRRNLAALLAEPPDQIVVVSDLHLGRGTLPDGDRMTSKENFFGDLAFRRLLRFWSRADDRDPGLLIILGDMLDFVRHDEPPRHDALDADDLLFWQSRLDEIGVRVKVEDLQRSITLMERNYGLKTDPLKSVYKLADIARGHADFFRGLAEWIGRGGRLLIIRGNHDLEWHWLAVRAALRAELKRSDPSGKITASDLETRVLFADQVGVSLGNLYLEHGNEFEPMTALGSNGPTLPRSPLELTYPLGSFVNRYLINPIEHIDPFLDKAKPVENAVLAVIKKYPLKSLGIAIRGWRFLIRALKMGNIRGGLAALGWMVLAVLPALTVAVIVGAIVCPEFGSWLTSLLGRGTAPAGIAGLAGPYLFGAAKELLADLKPPKTIDQRGFPKREADLEALPGPLGYFVVGHSHELDSRVIFREDERAIHFINTGSWTPTWTAHPKDVRAGTVYPFVVFVRGAYGYVHSYCEWDDARNGPVPAVMLDRS